MRDAAQGPGGAHDAHVADASMMDGSATDASALDAGDASGAQDAYVPEDPFDASVLDAGPRHLSVALNEPPTYLGNSGTGTDCMRSFRTAGHKPSDPAGGRPLFLYFVGTAGTDADETAHYDAKAPQAVTEAMARRGFVALSVEYDNSLAAILTADPLAVLSARAACIFSPSAPQSLLAKACALADVNCGLGIATWGHSQGGYLAHAARNHDERVRATWATGYGGNTGFRLPAERLRVVSAEKDTANASTATLNKATGQGCPDDGRTHCLRADGSGWIRVTKAACAVSAADHCWFNKASCADNAETLEPNFLSPSSSAPFALETNADWVAVTTARP